MVRPYQERRDGAVVGDRQIVVAGDAEFRRHDVGRVKKQSSGRHRAWRVDEQDVVLRSRLCDQLHRGLLVPARALLRILTGNAPNSPGIAATGSGKGVFSTREGTAESGNSENDRG
jgi:hypothetical protein